MHTKKKNWLVTGGAGFIGTALVRALLAQKQQVTVLDDFSSGCPRRHADLKNAVTLIKGSVLDPKALQKAARGADFILHFAAAASVAQSFENPAETLRVNTLGTAAVLEAARKNGAARVLFASSSSVYGSGGKTPRGENAPLHPLSPYALSKKLGEDLCLLYARIYGAHALAVRCFNVYGPEQDFTSPYAAVLARWMDRAARGLPIILNGDGRQTRDFLHVSDAAAAVLLAARKGRSGEIYNVGMGQSVTLLRAAKLLEKTAGKKLHLSFAPAREGDVRYSSADVSKLHALGFTPKISLEEGLQALWAARTARCK